MKKPSDLPDDPVALEDAVKEDKEEDEQDEAFLLARLKTLRVAKQAMEKKQRIPSLKWDITEAKEHLSFLKEAPASQPPSTSASLRICNPLDDILVGNKSSSLNIKKSFLQ